MLHLVSPRLFTTIALAYACTCTARAGDNRCIGQNEMASIVRGLIHESWEKDFLSSIRAAEIHFGKSHLLFPSVSRDRVDSDSFDKWCEAHYSQATVQKTIGALQAAFPDATPESVDAVSKVFLDHALRNNGPIEIRWAISLMASSHGPEMSREVLSAIAIIIANSGSDLKDSLIGAKIASSQSQILDVLRSHSETSVLARYVELLAAFERAESVVTHFANLASGDFQAPFSLCRGSNEPSSIIAIDSGEPYTISSIAVSEFQVLEGLRSCEEIRSFARTQADRMFQSIMDHIFAECDANAAFHETHREDIDLLTSRLLQFDSKNIVLRTTGWLVDLRIAMDGDSVNPMKHLPIEAVKITFLLRERERYTLGSRVSDYYSLLENLRCLADRNEKELVKKEMDEEKVMKKRCPVPFRGM